MKNYSSGGTILNEVLADNCITYYFMTRENNRAFFKSISTHKQNIARTDFYENIYIARATCKSALIMGRPYFKNHHVN